MKTHSVLLVMLTPEEADIWMQRDTVERDQLFDDMLNESSAKGLTGCAVVSPAGILLSLISRGDDPPLILET